MLRSACSFQHFRLKCTELNSIILVKEFNIKKIE